MIFKVGRMDGGLVIIDKNFGAGVCLNAQALCLIRIYSLHYCTIQDVRFQSALNFNFTSYSPPPKTSIPYPIQPPPPYTHSHASSTTHCTPPYAMRPPTCTISGRNVTAQGRKASPVRAVRVHWGRRVGGVVWEEMLVWGMS